MNSIFLDNDYTYTHKAAAIVYAFTTDPYSIVNFMYTVAHIKHHVILLSFLIYYGLLVYGAI